MCVLLLVCVLCCFVFFFFFCQAEDGIRDLVRSRGLGDVYKRQVDHVDLLMLPVEMPIRTADQQPLEVHRACRCRFAAFGAPKMHLPDVGGREWHRRCLLYTSDAADERSSVDLGGRRIIKKNKKKNKKKLAREAGTRQRR